MPIRNLTATRIQQSTTKPPPTSSSSSLSSSVSQSHLHNFTMLMRHRFPWRLPNHWSKTIVALSRRRNKKGAVADKACFDDPITSPFIEVAETLVQASTTPFTCNANNTINPRRTALSTLSTLSTTSTYCSATLLPISKYTTSIMAYVVALLFFVTTCIAASPCDSHSWWDPVKDKCIPCTLCQGEMIPLRPCQLHRDTICGSIYDLKIDWVVLAKTEPNWKERRKYSEGDYHLEQQLTPEELQQLHEESIPLDWQTIALFMAVLACLLFFIAAACILVHHMRQWRRMERRLDQDVEELSTKLMAKLAEVQSLEGGTFFIGNADALRIPTTFQPQRVLLPEKPAKYNDRRIIKTLQPGNVYIEENSSKG